MQRLRPRRAHGSIACALAFLFIPNWICLSCKSTSADPPRAKPKKQKAAGTHPRLALGFCDQGLPNRENNEVSSKLLFTGLADLPHAFFRNAQLARDDFKSRFLEVVAIENCRLSRSQSRQGTAQVATKIFELDRLGRRRCFDVRQRVQLCFHGLRLASLSRLGSHDVGSRKLSGSSNLRNRGCA